MSPDSEKMLASVSLVISSILFLVNKDLGPLTLVLSVLCLGLVIHSTYRSRKIHKIERDLK